MAAEAVMENPSVIEEVIGDASLAMLADMTVMSVSAVAIVFLSVFFIIVLPPIVLCSVFLLSCGLWLTFLCVAMVVSSCHLLFQPFTILSCLVSLF